MKTIVTEEFDADGKLTKRTTVTEDAPANGGYVYVQPQQGTFTLGTCNCPTSWHSITPPPPCPVHGSWTMPTITCGTGTSVTVNCDTDATPEEIASRVGWSLRSMS